MEAIREKLNPLAKKGTLDKTVDDIQAAIDALTRAKDKIHHGQPEHSLFACLRR
jgi:hemerythrin-like domain-containing protein